MIRRRLYRFGMALTVTELQIAAMNRSPHVDFGRIKAYLQAILAEWSERLPD